MFIRVYISMLSRYLIIYIYGSSIYNNKKIELNFLLLNECVNIIRDIYIVRFYIYNNEI